jgi:phospholipase/carboxylesterase
VSRNAVGIDAGAVLWSADERGRAGRPLLVMMHGWSYDETHLFALTPRLPQKVVVASVRAPRAEAGGYAWFLSAGNPIGNPQPRVANEAVDEVMTWLDTLSGFSSVGLMGFSQGGAMAIQLLRHSPDRFAYTVNLGGFVVDGTLPGDKELAVSRPPAFWGRGQRDYVIPDAAITRTEEWTARHTTAETHVYPQLGHDVAGQEVTDLANFVARHA